MSKYKDQFQAEEFLEGSEAALENFQETLYSLDKTVLKDVQEEWMKKMQHIQGDNRNQIQMISLEQMVEPESLVRIIDAFIDMLDLEQFGFSYFKLNKEGRPPFHPATLMKLY